MNLALLAMSRASLAPYLLQLSKPAPCAQVTGNVLQQALHMSLLCQCRIFLGASYLLVKWLPGHFCLPCLALCLSLLPFLLLPRSPVKMCKCQRWLPELQQTQATHSWQIGLCLCMQAAMHAVNEAQQEDRQDMQLHEQELIQLEDLPFCLLLLLLLLKFTLSLIVFILLDAEVSSEVLDLGVQLIDNCSAVFPLLNQLWDV